MFYPYCVLGEDIEVVQTPLNKQGITVVHFEKPDPIFCFKTLDCTVPYYIVSGIVGFTNDEVADLVDFCRNNSGLLLLGARTEGVLRMPKLFK